MNDISRKLIDKSQEAFITAIEIYNKPTLHYRVEGFSFFICNAWELMLKARLIETKGENSIYYGDNPDRTLSLSNCVELVFTNDKDPLRLNLEHIIELRNTSTHYITEEYEQIYIPLFQSCVFNYMNKMLEFFHEDVTGTIPANFLTLSVRISPWEPEEIQARYPRQIALRILKTQEEIADSIPAEGNDKYAVVIRHDIFLTKRADLASATVRITRDAKEAAYILKETRDMQKVCPHNRKHALAIINRWIEREHVAFVNPSKDPADEKAHVFTSSHFDLVSKFYGIKQNPKYCYQYKSGEKTVLYTYSEAALRFIFEEIKKDPGHIIQHLKEKINKK